MSFWINLVEVDLVLFNTLMNTFYSHFKKMFGFSDRTYHMCGVIAVAGVFSLYHLLKLLEKEQIDASDDKVVDEMNIPSEIREEA